MVQKSGMEERVLFSSFNLLSVVKCKQILPKVPAGFLMETRMDNVGTYAKDYQVNYYHPDKNYLTQDLVEDCHRRGIGVNVWTVNKKKRMKQMIEWNVDGIFTNYPDKAMKLRKNEKGNYQMETLKSEGKTKSVTYKTLFAKK